MYEIIFYEDAHGNCPISDFISTLDQAAQTDKDARIQLKQLMFHLDLLTKAGTRCSPEYVKHIRDDVWELRPGKNRLLFFGWDGNNFVVLHHFRKTTNKTPSKEIEQAERNLSDWVSRNGR